MIPESQTFDQRTMRLLIEHNDTVQRYRALFALLEWRVIPEPSPDPSRPGKRPHPPSAYIKALLIKLTEGYAYCTQLRRFLIEHPLLVLELGFRPVLNIALPYGFDVQRTVPSARWFTEQQRTLDHRLLKELFAATVQALLEEIPGLGETVAFDVKHIYGWVRENNLREHIKDRFCKERQPKGDRDCRVGVKTSTNQEQHDGSTKEVKEYLWGYGSGIAAATVADYGDVVLAEHTLPFNETDITYFLPLYIQTVAILGFFPTNITADAAFDAWYTYQTCAFRGGIAAIALNSHGHPSFPRDADGTPRCPLGLRMQPTYQFQHTKGYRAQRYRCPLLFPQPTGQTCEHEQFAKAKGCVKDIDIEAGGLMRVLLDRDGPLYKAIYRQRTCAERINSQAKALGIERPKVRHRPAVARLNTLTYILINAKALKRARAINASLLTCKSAAA